MQPVIAAIHTLTMELFATNVLLFAVAGALLLNLFKK